MAEEKIKAAEVMSDEELDGVAGGTWQDFKEVCKALGKSPTFNTRNGIRDLLKKEYGITVAHWNTGDRGSEKEAPAEFLYKSQQLTLDQVKGMINGTWKPEESISLDDFT